MKRLLYPAMAIILFSCSNSSAPKDENITVKDTPPIYTISDLQKSGLKGKIKHIYGSEIADLASQSNNDQAVIKSAETYNENGFLLQRADSATYISDMSYAYFIKDYFYKNNILHHVTLSSALTDEPMQTVCNYVYDWPSPLSNKARIYYFRNGGYDSTDWKSEENFYDNNFRLVKTVAYLHDTTKISEVKTHTFDKAGNIDTTWVDGKISYITTITDHDQEGNPWLVTREVPNGEKKSISYTYEYYQ